MSPKLVDQEPGGESSQYESIKTVTQAPAKQSGQLGANEKHTISEVKKLPSDSENEGFDDRYKDPSVESQSDPGLTGITTNVIGKADNDKDLNPESQGIDEEARRNRTAQGYGPGSGIGA